MSVHHWRTAFALLALSAFFLRVQAEPTNVSCPEPYAVLGCRCVQDDSERCNYQPTSVLVSCEGEAASAITEFPRLTEEALLDIRCV